MAKFSKIFGIDLKQSQLDFVDVDPSRDTPLFIDPYAISIKDDQWSNKCNSHIVSFFDTALEQIRQGKEVEAKRLLNGLGEPNETCLGVSRGRPQGRGVSGKQAIDLYKSLANSQAAKSGLLSEIAECDLFVSGIGRDKTSDITTNILRRLLIEYTQHQCDLHGVKLGQEVASGRFWDVQQRRWCEEHVRLPVVRGRRIILVPKYSVRRSLALNNQEYYTHFILNFLQEDELRHDTGLVRVLKDGTRKVCKTDLKERFPFSKDFLAQFSSDNPEVLKKYKEFHRELPGAKGVLSNRDLDEDFDEAAFCEALLDSLRQIPPGQADAQRYHSFMVGTLEFLFWPNLIYPTKEKPIHAARKKIDITYTNAAKSGFFWRVHTSYQIASITIMVECKNYSSDPSNPELDQLSGRFSVNRGKLGLLVFRTTDDHDRLIQRCRDTAGDGRGFILPLGDDQINEYLALVRDGGRQAIDQRLEAVLQKIIS